MSDEKESNIVVFNNDIFEEKKDIPSYSKRKRITYTEYPELSDFGIIAVAVGIFLLGGIIGYTYGITISSKLSIWIVLLSISVILLGLVMDYYSSNVYYKRDD